MKDNDVAFIGTLLGLETDAVNSAIEDGTVGDKITALNLMGSDQVETLKTNLTKDVKETYFGELVEQAKTGELPPDLYKPIHGAVFEKTEKELAKTYEVDKGTLMEMIAKISTNGRSNDNKQLLDKITGLQEANENLVKEKDDGIAAVKTEYKGKSLSRDKADQLRSVPFDFSDVEDAKLEATKQSSHKLLNDVFDARFSLDFSDDKLVVKGKDDKILKDPVTLEPLPVLNVMKDLASELRFKLISPETGGQGGKSSGGNGNAAFTSKADFDKHCEEKKINPTSVEGLKLWKERKPQ